MNQIKLPLHPMTELELERIKKRLGPFKSSNVRLLEDIQHLDGIDVARMISEIEYYRASQQSNREATHKEQRIAVVKACTALGYTICGACNEQTAQLEEGGWIPTRCKCWQSEIEQSDSELQMALAREQTWKDQCARDQEENRVLKARLNGAHVTKPGQTDITGEHEYSEGELIRFLREAARNAKEGTWGMWRAKEFEAAADQMERMYQSYLDVCPHEQRAEQAKGRTCEHLVEPIRNALTDLRSAQMGPLTNVAQKVRDAMATLEAAING